MYFLHISSQDPATVLGEEKHFLPDDEVCRDPGRICVYFSDFFSAE